jgi:hypothetical protein
MGRHRSSEIAILLLAAALLLPGCAGTARGVKQSVYQHDEGLSVVDLSRSNADAMVVIRYPAIVDEDALPAYYQAFGEQAIGGEVKADSLPWQDRDRIAQSVIAKSNYFAMSLYRELRDQLPEHSVLLSPHLVELDTGGRLVSRPLLAVEEIPAVLNIDFSVYSYPDSRKMMDSPPLTFGDIVTPLFVLHANRWLRPSTFGLLLASDPLLRSAWAQSEQQATEQVSHRLEDRVDGYSRPLDFINFLAGLEPQSSDLPVKSAGETRRDVVAVEIHPLEKIRMDGEVVGQLATDASVDPFAEDFVKGAATRVVTALNRVDHDRATFFSRQIALSRFDPALGSAFLARSADEAMRARLQMGEALIAAERKFLSAQSASLYEGAYEGLYGSQMRQMIAAEYRLLEDRRDLARTQNFNTALAIVAMAGAVYIGSNGDGGNFFESQTMSNILMLSSLWAMNSAFGANAESRTVGENFLVQIAPAISRQVTVQVEWLESREEITARDFAGFREQTLALYQRSVRGVSNAVERDCAFRDASGDAPGRWFGPCDQGLAFGSGYGLLAEDSGRVVEYVGTADAGLADGAGAMIVRAPGVTGAVYLEGEFRAGRPDGVLRVEEPGRKPRFRVFQAGKDAGAANADDLQRIQF